jgi:polyhydroxyalkanoate synthesis regulator phasin
MKEMLKNMVYAGIGAAFLTKEKIEELKGDLIEKGQNIAGGGQRVCR